MDTILDKYVKTFKKALAAEQIECIQEKSINYGYHMVCAAQGEQIKANLYHGKKGLSTVIQGKEGPLKVRLEAIAAGKQGCQVNTEAVVPSAIPLPAGTETWMGCDESGKGDVFGPLCCAACIVTQQEAIRLQQAGVCDSKNLTDQKILKLAVFIRKILEDRCVVRTVMPGTYNQLYAEYKSKRQNLNHLLGGVHAGNIRVLLSKYKCPCIIVDKFGKEEYVLSQLDGLVKDHTIIQVTKGERDIAVAAASILAREAFVKAMDSLEQKFSMTFPKGAYAGIPETIALMIERYGEGQLAEVGKLNFKNFDFLQ